MASILHILRKNNPFPLSAMLMDRSPEHLQERVQVELPTVQDTGELWSFTGLHPNSVNSGGSIVVCSLILTIPLRNVSRIVTFRPVLPRVLIFLKAGKKINAE